MNTLTNWHIARKEELELADNLLQLCFMRDKIELPDNLLFLNDILANNFIPASIYILDINNSCSGVAFLANQNETLEILFWCLAPGWRGNGFGNLIINQIINEAKSRSFKTIICKLGDNMPAAASVLLNSGFKQDISIDSNQNMPTNKFADGYLDNTAGYWQLDL